MSAMRGEVARCRLVRSDGSEWRVTDFQIGEGTVRVDARLERSPRDHEARERQLESEPLMRGDRVEWLKDDGSLIWAMRNPVDGAVHWEVESNSEPTDFLEGDFQESA